MCCVKAKLSGKHFSHRSHLCRFIFKWTDLLCLWSVSSLLKAFPQTSHSTFDVAVWILIMWRFKKSGLPNVLPHFGQLKRLPSLSDVLPPPSTSSSSSSSLNSCLISFGSMFMITSSGHSSSDESDVSLKLKNVDFFYLISRIVEDLWLGAF